MPLFDYLCKKCSNKEERLVTSKNQEVFCDKCGSEMERKETSKIVSVFPGRLFTAGKKDLL